MNQQLQAFQGQNNITAQMEIVVSKYKIYGIFWVKLLNKILPGVNDYLTVSENSAWLGLGKDHGLKFEVNIDFCLSLQLSVMSPVGLILGLKLPSLSKK